MERLQERQVQSIHRVHEWLEATVLDEPAIAKQARLLAKVSDALFRLAQEQHSARAGLPSDGIIVRTLAADLRTLRMIPVSRIGKQVLRFVPGAEGALKVPGKSASPARICAAAETMAKFVKPKWKPFVERGLPRDFAIRMAHDAAALRARLGVTDTARAQHVDATARLARLIGEARREVDILDGLIMAHEARNNPMVKSWKRAKRVGRPRGRPKGQAKKKDDDHKVVADNRKAPCARNRSAAAVNFGTGVPLIMKGGWCLRWHVTCM